MGRSQETMFLLNTESDILNTKETTLPSSTPSKNNTAGSIQAKREMYLRYQKRRKNHRSSDAQVKNKLITKPKAVVQALFTPHGRFSRLVSRFFIGFQKF